MKNLKRIILILILLVIIIVTILLILNKNQNVDNNIKDSDGNYDESNIKPVINTNTEPVKNHTQFYAVSDAIQKYYDYLNADVSDLNVDKNAYDVAMAEMTGINDRTSKSEAVYSLLDTEYIKENNISKDNVLTKIKDTGPVQFYALSMNYLDGTVNQRFAVLGKIRLLEDKYKYQNVAFIVTVGKDISLYMIRPLKKEYSNVKEIELQEYNDTIEKNNYNILKYTTYKDDKITQKYFDYYKEIVHYDKDEIYNLLDDEYKNKRFGSKEVFSKYIDSIEDSEDVITAKQYTVNTYDDYKEYVCKDQYENLYIFKEKAPMDVTIELDTYTLDTDKFKERYNSSNTQYKVMMNIDKVRQMMNVRDYRSMFKYLDESFRKTYFENDVDKFEDYMKYHFPSHYKFEYGDYSEDSGISIQDVTMEDMTGKDTTNIGEKFYMQLNEGTDFVMSFNVIGK